jgi:hypothetical protein
MVETKYLFLITKDKKKLPNLQKFYVTLYLHEKQKQINFTDSPK